jgi:replicative DNA helicase
MAQLSRAVEKRFGGDEPILSDLRDSWSIEQDSDVVLMLHKEDDKCLKVLVRKNRNWPLGAAYQLMNARYMQIWDMTEEQKQFYINQWE